MKNPDLTTWKNLEAAFAGESMAHQKYLYFADLCRRKGAPEVAKLFEDTARHETGHATGHLRFLFPEDQLSVEEILEIAIAGETYEYTEMYPGFERTAVEEGVPEAVAEFREQQVESAEHAAAFRDKLVKVAKLFRTLAKVEKTHAEGYEAALGNRRDTESG